MLKAFEPLVVGAVAAGGASSAAIDLRVRRVPNPMTLGITMIGLTLAALHATSVTLERTAALLSAPGVAAEIEHPREDNRFAYAPAIAVGALAAALGF